MDRRLQSKESDNKTKIEVSDKHRLMSRVYAFIEAIHSVLLTSTEFIIMGLFIKIVEWEKTLDRGLSIENLFMTFARGWDYVGYGNLSD